MADPVRVEVTTQEELRAALADVAGAPVLVSVGGAGGMARAHLAAVATVLREHVVPAVEAAGAVVLDGGTDAGVMRLMGDARRAAGATFPLVGVAAAGTLAPAGEPGSGGTAAEEPGHSRLLVVPGESWGAESAWLSAAAEVVAAGRPVVTLLVNGGDITLADVERSLAAGRPVVAVRGTGRLADAVASGGASPASVRVAASSLVHVVDADDGARLAAVVGRLLTAAAG